MSISRLPPRIFMPLASSGVTIGLVRLATPPACQIQVTTTMPFSARICDRNLPTSAFFHLLPISYDGTSAGSRPMLVSGTSPPEYESGTSDMSSAPLRSALNCEFTLTSDEFGIDLELEPAVGPLLDVGGELAHQTIAEIARSRSSRRETGARS